MGPDAAAAYKQTLRHLCGKRRGNCDKIKVFRAVMYRQLAALVLIVGVTEALVHELIKRKTSV